MSSPVPIPLWWSASFRLSARDVVVEYWHHFSRKRQQPLLGRVWIFTGVQGGGYAYECAIAAVHAYGIGDQVKFRPVLTGYAAIMGPIPIEHQLAIGSFSDHVTIRGKGRVAGQRNRDSGGLEG